MTETSNEVLRGNQKVELFKATEKEEKSTSLVSQISHPYIQELFEELKAIRMQFSKSENVPPYVIFSDATLIELATYLPLSKLDMLKMSGVGDVKFNKYGQDFMAAVVEYCEANAEETRIKLKAPQKKKRKQRNRKGEDTNTISLNLFKSGMSVLEVANERGFTLSTIETHLATFIPSGEIQVEDLVSSEKIDPIRKAIAEIGVGKGISPVKKHLGDHFSYGEIRAVAAEMA